MAYLARREHTALELTRKLTQKGYELHIIKPTLSSSRLTTCSASIGMHCWQLNTGRRRVLKEEY